MDVPSPGETLADAVEEAAEESTDNLPVVAGGPGDASEASTDDGEQATGNRSVSGALQHTQPDLSPQRVEADHEVSKSASHAYVGARKVVHYLADMGDKAKDGTMAAENFLWAAYHGFTGRTDDAGDDQEASDDLGDEFEDGPAEFHDPAEEVAP